MDSPGEIQGRLNQRRILSNYFPMHGYQKTPWLQLKVSEEQKGKSQLSTLGEAGICLEWSTVFSGVLATRFQAT